MNGIGIDMGSDMGSDTGSGISSQRSGNRNPALYGGLTALVAATLLAGCATGNASSPARLAADATAALTRGNVDRSVRLAEQAVSADPRNGQYRVLLGNAYLRAGRFASARQAYGDAVELGVTDGKVTLSLALVEIAQGDNGAALRRLAESGDAVPASDRGLALALAGDTGHAINLLTQQMRQGENTAKVRQNLAFAYALDGRWLQARVMAAQDVPADQLDARMSEWASLTRPDAARQRVAGLLKVPMVNRDAGLPKALALTNSASIDELAEQVAPEGPQQPSAQLAADEELPALEDVAPVRQSAALTTPARAPYMAPTPAYAPAPAAKSAPLVTQASASRIAAAPRKPVVAATPLSVGQGTHLLQLGSFASAEGANRAWQHYSARMPQLRSYRNVTTQVTVNGKKFWRLQVAGFAGKGVADTTCGTVKARGGACLVMAAPKPVAPGQRTTDMRLASRR